MPQGERRNIMWRQQLYKSRKVEVNVGKFRHYSVRKSKTRPSIYHQPPSYSENLYKEDILPDGLFDLIVFSSTSLLVAIFSNLNNSLCVNYATDYLHITLRVRIKEVRAVRQATCYVMRMEQNSCYYSSTLVIVYQDRNF